MEKAGQQESIGRQTHLEYRAEEARDRAVTDTSEVVGDIAAAPEKEMQEDTQGDSKDASAGILNDDNKTRQVNLNMCRAASDLLNATVRNWWIDISILAEPNIALTKAEKNYWLLSKDEGAGAWQQCADQTDRQR